MTKNSGPSYDNVVRELADVTGFEYPETPQEVVSFQRDFNSKMMIRMRRRQQREAEDRQQHAQSAASGGGGKATKNGNNNGAVTLDAGGTASTEMTQRKTTAAAKKNRPVVVKMPSPKQVRNWMIMAPDEWGFCQQSNQPKPPRSHYDHVTKTLVLCLDHYCPWMFNAGTLQRWWMRCLSYVTMYVYWDVFWLSVKPVVCLTMSIECSHILQNANKLQLNNQQWGTSITVIFATSSGLSNWAWCMGCSWPTVPLWTHLHWITRNRHWSFERQGYGSISILSRPSTRNERLSHWHSCCVLQWVLLWHVWEVFTCI